MSNYGNYPNIQLCRKYGCHHEKTKMLMCIGCGIPEKEKQQHIESVQNKALAYAKEIGKLVIVYIDTDGMYKYMESEAAKSAGVQPFSYAPVL